MFPAGKRILDRAFPRGVGESEVPRSALGICGWCRVLAVSLRIRAIAGSNDDAISIADPYPAAQPHPAPRCDLAASAAFLALDEVCGAERGTRVTPLGTLPAQAHQ